MAAVLRLGWDAADVGRRCRVALRTALLALVAVVQPHRLHGRDQVLRHLARVLRVLGGGRPLAQPLRLRTKCWCIR